MQVGDFLRATVTTPEGWLCLAFRNGAWQESFYKWPEQHDQIVAESEKLREHGDVYFSSHLFSEQRSAKKYVLPSRTLQADLDSADVANLSVLPTVLVQTSPGRHQGFWVLDKPMQPVDIETWARRIAYGVPDCDRTGWPAGHKMRLPDTFNHKYERKPPVQIVGVSLRALQLDILNNFPELQVSLQTATADLNFIENTPGPLPVNVMDLLLSLKQVMPARIYSQFAKQARDRSAALWAFSSEALKAGLAREQVFWLAKASVNNKFEGRRQGDADLRRDILRAEQHLAVRTADIRSILVDMRKKQQTSYYERASDISRMVMNTMREQGEFVHARNGMLWFLQKSTGRPIELTIHSPWLNTYLNVTFGLNATENFTTYTIQDLQAYCRSLPPSIDLQTLSYYEPFTHTLMLHAGGRDVYHITKDAVHTRPNGYGSIVFQWAQNADGFNLDTAALQPNAPNTSTPVSSVSQPTAPTWYDIMFGSSAGNVAGVERAEFLAVMRAWLLFLLFRKAATTRPILTLLGQPGCLSGNTKIAIYAGNSKHPPQQFMASLKDLHAHWDTSNTYSTLSHTAEDHISIKRIEYVIHSGLKQTYRVDVAGALAPVYATSDHRFLTPLGYRPLHELLPGDLVVTRYGLNSTAATRITAIKKYKIEDTYDINMADDTVPNFLVNDVVVHNSGKTSLAKRVYTLVYGRSRQVATVGTQEDFDLQTAGLPLIAYDNLDTWLPWLPDRLATATGDTDVVRRKLYSDVEEITLRRQAMLLLTAHSPRFTREDVMDRMLLFQFSRLEHFDSETTMIADIQQHRNSLWTEIVNDVQAVLRTAQPAHNEAPQFRIEDFSYLGLWFSRAAGAATEAAFRSALDKIKSSARGYSLEQDQVLVGALRRYVARHASAPEDTGYIRTDSLHARLLTCAADPVQFLKTFKSPLLLGKKLWVSQSNLKAVFDIDWKFDDGGSAKLWRIVNKAAQS